jgi:hypothetical protein
MALAATLANLIAQGALLVFSLWALAYNRDVMPPWVGILLAVLGVGLLADSAWYAMDARSLRRRHYERRDSGGTDAGVETEKLD